MVRALLALLVLKKSVQILFWWGLLQLERWDGTRFTCFTRTREKCRREVLAYKFAVGEQIRCSSAKSQYAVFFYQSPHASACVTVFFIILIQSDSMQLSEESVCSFFLFQSSA
jgi:hypothetical protein